MPTVKLTEKVISRLRAPTLSGRQEIFWDEGLRGFGILLSGKTRTRTFIVQRSLPSGLKRRATIASCAELSLIEAREKATKLLLAIREGRDPKARHSNLTLRQTLDAYLAARKDLRPRSAASYRDAVTRHLEKWMDKPLGEITVEMIQKRHSAIQSQVAASGRGTGHAVANGVMRTFRLLWNFAAESDGQLGPNPAVLKRQWFAVPARERMVKDEELPAFYKAACELPNPVHRAYVLLLLFTGLRRREATGLRWADVDMTARTIKITATRAKNGRTLNLPMSDFIFDLMVRTRQLTGGEEFVFAAASRSKHLEEPKFIFDQIAEASGVRVSPHDLRRGFVTTANDAEISALSLKALVNHVVGGNADVTGSYLQLTSKRLMGPMQKVTDRLKELCGIRDTVAPNVAKLRGLVKF